MDNETGGVEREVQQLRELASRHRFGQMREVLKQALPLEPDNPDLLYYAAQVDWMEDKDEEALATITRMVELYPDSYAGRLLLFNILDTLGRRSEAEAVIIEMLREYPEDGSLYAAYSILMLKTMQVEKAGELASRAISLTPEDSQALTASVLHELITNPGESARNKLADLVSHDPDAANTALTMVAVLVDQNQLKQALPIAQEVLRQNPDSEDIVDLVVALKADTHWSMAPLRPIQKWGWGASVGLWFGIIILLRALEGTPVESFARPVSLVFLAFVIYSWVWPPIIKRWVRG